MLDPSAYTLMPNGGNNSASASSSALNSPSPTRTGTAAGGNSGSLSPRPQTSGGGTRYIVQDTRWRFVTEDKFPVARNFTGNPKRYRAGRGSSVPLDLSLLT